MEPTKPGYTTTEFWVSIISVAAILLKLAGIDVTPADQNALASSLAGLIVGFLAVMGIVTRYIKSRTDTKVAQMEAGIALEAAKAGRPVTLSLGRK